MLLTNFSSSCLWARLPRNIRFLAAISSSAPPPNPHTLGPFQVFDRAAKTIQKDRAAERDARFASRTVDYVREEVADRMMERLLVWYIILQIKSTIDYFVGYQT